MRVHSHHFIADPAQPCPPSEWFNSLPEAVEPIQTSSGLVLYFPKLGELLRDGFGQIDGARSPVVLIVEPAIRREALWTLGEVKFLPTDITRHFRRLPK